MSTIDKKQQEIVEEFSVFDDWMDKYAYLIEQGKELTGLKDEHRTDNNVISGCQSKVWLHAEYEEGKIKFTADSDAVLTKGLVALVIKVFSNEKPDTIINAEPWFIKEIGLEENLSPTRSNGLNAMLKQIKFYAMAFKAKHG
ncbi:Cysteine desulfuration protein SufE [Salinivirga cyanobacteriivorans]|uniref:Cysteine desulfuration protein SufE n=1 Tax=Salinivirga cyanobacteriivorans TaxID=1307839 RepID=A0A0S2I149_9BACT|nr:SufE family protein [Salinivirga cyanobacteriivorans]ALO15877.1 Cysteine desulfuration protein SufE [Salinivirga cyanobacteriivorans]